MRAFRLVLVLVLLALLSGCATSTMNAKGFNGSILSAQKIQGDGPDLRIEPYQSLGIIPVDSNSVVAMATAPNALVGGEYWPGRIRWNAWAVTPNGQEFFGQAVLVGLDFNGRFVFWVVINGNQQKLEGAKVVILSTQVDYMYSLLGQETQLERNQFLESRSYRQKMVLAYGSALDDMRKATSLLKIAEKWNLYDTPKGNLLSPLGEKEVKAIAAINPRYDWSEKFIASGRFSLSMDPIGTFVSLAIDLIKADKTPAVGWDYDSQLPSRRVMGRIIDFILTRQQKLIEQINRENVRLKGGTQ